jgi:hypothetical protein
MNEHTDVQKSDGNQTAESIEFVNGHLICPRTLTFELSLVKRPDILTRR